MTLNLRASSYSLFVLNDTHHWCHHWCQVQNLFNILALGLSFSESTHSSYRCLKVMSALQLERVSG